MMGDHQTFSIMESFDKNSFRGVDAFVAVPYPLLEEARKRLPPFIHLAAQDLSVYQQGPHSGEVSAQMLRDFGVCYVIVGHSERRIANHESNEEVARKLKNALTCGLFPVLCIGEEEECRKKGKHLKWLSEQLCASLGGLRGRTIDIAYEPVWAIGSGCIPRIEEIEEVLSTVHKLMEELEIAGRILYGGSVTVDNVSQLCEVKFLGGLLVGGASLSADFERIAKGINASM